MSARNWTTSFAGATGRSGNARWLRLIVTVMVLGLGLTFQLTGGGAAASPTSAFEIDDANIVDGAAATADWGSVFGRDPAGGATAPVVVKNASGLLAASFTEDPLSSDNLPSPPCAAGKKGDLTAFTSGGSDKNGDDIDTWTYESGSVPNSKDDLTNVYATAIKDGTHNVFYFGFDRANTNGSSHFDFEFVKAPMGLQATGTDSSGCPSGHFTGSRTVGDILLSMNFENGGTVGIEDVRLWDGDSYESVGGSLAGKVGLFANGGNIACGDWRCRDASGATITQLPANAFLEGYIDATAIGVSGCFSTFNAKSRSSHSYTSELKDFALGNFNTCDANISITPNGVNEVGDSHTFTGHVNVNPDGPFVNAPAGTIINFAKVSGPGSFVGNVAQCATIGTTGSCSVTLTSPTAGTTVVSASTTVQVGPLTLTRSTSGNAGAGGSGNATKEWVDGYIKITPDGVNEVNHQHVFTAEFGVMPGGADKVTDVHINADVTPNPDTETSTCANPTSVGTNVWQCTITVNSATTGVFTANATGTANVAKTGVADIVALSRSTTGNHGPGGSGAAVKTYVDARIKVGPNGLNEVNDHHTVTGTLETKDGNGAWNPAAGKTITFQKVSGPGSFVSGDNDCVTGANGTCTVQLTSPDVGSTVVNATAWVTVHGVALTRSTDANVAPNGPGGTGNMTKKWADASIKVVETAVNEVNHQHVFTVTATAHRPANETVAFSSITPTVDPTPGSQSTTCGSPVISGGGLVATCTFTINNPTPGTFDVDATAVVTFDDGSNPKLTITRSTDPAVAPAGPNGNAGATKKFVDARVSVGPDGVNAVGDNHTVTGKAGYNDASGWKAAEGETIHFAITQGVGEFVGGVDECVATADGTCSVAIVSNDPGVTWVSASTSYDVLGVALNRTTSVSGPTDPDNLRKEWVAAEIEITPSAVNPVGVPHTFDIKVTATSSGAAITFGAVGTTVTPAPDSKSDTCAPGDRDVNGGVLTCTLTISNDTAGVFTANATAQITVGGVVFDLATNGQGGSGVATKTYVDARISVGPDGVNAVGDPHPVNAHLEVNNGTGWTDAPAGTTITLAILSGPGSLTADSCVTNAGGACGVTLNSDTAGTTVVSASSTVSVLGVPLTRSTNSNAGPGGSDNLIKQWVNASVAITPDGLNKVGDQHIFTVTASVIPPGLNTVSFDSIVPSVTPAPSSQSSTCATPQIVNQVATCTVTINSTSTGVFTANATAHMTIGGVAITRSTNPAVAPAGPNGSGPAVKAYVDSYIKITPNGVNPVGQAHVFTAEFGVLTGGNGDVSDVTIAADVAPNPDLAETSTCAAPTPAGTNVWRCTITINSSVTGVFTANATGTAKVTKAGVADVVDITRSTDANVAPHGPGGSGPATKTYVDARIKVGPDGLNEVNDHHTVTGTVEAKDGNGAWAPVGDTVITFAKAGGPGGFVGDDDDCTTDGGGTCTVQITSADVGSTIVSATADINVHGVTMKRSTDAAIAPNGAGGSGNMTKKWADASIRVVETAVNEVNHQHVFTVTATAHRPANETVAFAAITPMVDPVPGSQSSTCANPVVSGGGLVATCTVTINSAVAGIFDVDATVLVTFDDGTNPKISITRSTDPTIAPAGPNGNSGATKRFVDARVSIGPDGVNAVGDPHTVTGKAESNDATGWAAAAGETIHFAITQGVGDFVGGVDSCVAGVDGTCSVAIVSDEPGVTWVSASTSYAVLGVTMSRTTAVSGATDDDNLRKEWVAASISIEPDAVNPVGKSHTFAITVTATSSGASISFGDVATSVTPTPSAKADTCAAADRHVDNNVLTCTLTINSDRGGVFTANATATVSIGGVEFNLATSGAGGTGPAVKTYVDADIQVTPNGVNAVGDPHAVTGHVNVDEGAGKVSAPAGTLIDFSIVSGPGSLTPSGCATVGTTGSCTVTLNSSTAGVTVVKAASNVNVEGVLFALVTNAQGANSGNLTKRWVDAFITIGPDAVNPLNKPHTFTVTVTAIPSGAAPVTFQSIAVSVDPAPGTQDTTCGTPQVSGNVATCTLTINSAVAGKFVANATAVVKVAGASVTRSTDAAVASAGPGGSGPATKTYIPPEVLGAQFLPRTGAFVQDHLLFSALLLLLGVISAGFGMRLWPVGTRRR
jgi:hypothetical protein